MEVKLLEYTPNPEELCTRAAQVCYSSEEFEDRKIPTLEERKRLLDKVIKSGHLSCVEHANFTFEICGVSRVFLAQLSRHRLVSLSVQSQRYVELDDPRFVIPSSCDDRKLKDDDYKYFSREEIFKEIMEKSWEYYNMLIKDGVPAEDARYVLPNACYTDIVMTVNARELMHILELRMCNRAQKEFRDVANEIYKQAMEVAPNIFKYAGPNCWFDGCTEGNSCGNPPGRI